MITGRGLWLVRLVAVAVSYVSVPLTANGQNLYGCVRPTGMPPVPDGSLATLAEIQAARESVEVFLNDGEAYLACLAKYPDDPLISAINEQVVLEMDLVVIRFNDALCAFSGGTQCVRTPSEDPEAFASTEFGGGAPAQESPSSEPWQDGATDDAFAPADGGDSVAGSDDGVDPADDFISQATINGSMSMSAGAEQMQEPSGQEPTLPDGMPCGSVTQTRSDTTGEGLTLRGHYAWELYNACFEPIRVRWTLRGDGLLNAQRSIPARGAQVIGCSTRAGTISSRYCTGGVEYAFEWLAEQ